MNRLTYSLLLYLVSPLLVLRLLFRSLRNPAYRRRWRERFAWYRDTRADTGPTLVIHAVSVGEVHAALVLVKAFRENHPDYRLVVTCTTPTGSQRIREQLGESVEHVYLPYDLPGAVGRFLARYTPEVLLVMETELWPNLIHQAHARGCRLLLANARLSEKSRRGYARFFALVRPMLEKLDRVAAQSEDDARRLVSLGLPEHSCSVTGNIKYDMALNAELEEAGQSLKRRCFGERPVLVAASTREGEELIVLRALQRVAKACPTLGFILVPRHPERFDEVWRACHEAGFDVTRRSTLEAAPPAGDVQLLLGDSMGEMQMYYAASDLAFVGGSLVPTGCQNILEPAAFGKPIITGPSLYNFRAVSDDFQASGAMQVVADDEALADAVIALVEQPDQRSAMGRAAGEAFRRRGGASRKVLALLDDLLEPRPYSKAP